MNSPSSDSTLEFLLLFLLYLQPRAPPPHFWVYNRLFVIGVNLWNHCSVTCVCVCVRVCLHIWLVEIQKLCGCTGASPYNYIIIILFRLTVGGLNVLGSLRPPSTRLLCLAHTPTNTPSLFWGQTWAEGLSDTEISMVTACYVFLWCMRFMFPERQQFLEPCAHVCLCLWWE